MVVKTIALKKISLRVSSPFPSRVTFSEQGVNECLTHYVVARIALEHGQSGQDV